MRTNEYSCSIKKIMCTRRLEDKFDIHALFTKTIQIYTFVPFILAGVNNFPGF